MPSINKDPLPTVRKNMVIYKFHGCCDAVYVGRTSLRLEDRITQHISATNQKSITKKPTRTQPHRPCKQKYQKEPKSENTQITPTAPTTAIGKHLLNNPECLTKFNKNFFSILAQARSKYHLSILESIFINSMKPSLCVQKNYVSELGLFPSGFFGNCDGEKVEDVVASPPGGGGSLQKGPNQQTRDPSGLLVPAIRPYSSLSTNCDPAGGDSQDAGASLFSEMPCVTLAVDPSGETLNRGHNFW